MEAAIEVQINPGSHGLREVDVQSIFMFIFTSPQYRDDNRLQIIEVIDKAGEVDFITFMNVDCLSDPFSDLLNVGVIGRRRFENGRLGQSVKGQIWHQFREDHTHILSLTDVIRSNLVCAFFTKGDDRFIPGRNFAHKFRKAEIKDSG